MKVKGRIVVTVLGLTVLIIAFSSQLFLTRNHLDVHADSGELRIVEVLTCDMNGNPKSSFEKENSMSVKISIDYSGTGAIWVLLTASTCDSKNVPIGLAWSNVSVVSGRSVSILTMLVPKSAETGKGVVFVDVYTDWPRNGGVPLCPEVSAFFEIIPRVILGDVTGPTLNVPDGIVDMRDIVAILTKFGTTPSSPNWNPNMDLNKDGIVNMRDVMLAIANRTL